MTGKEITIFDSRSEEYKRPFGAVTGGTKVFLRIAVRSDIKVKNIWTVVLYDRHWQPAWYPMVAVDELVRDYDYYEVEIPFGDTGLYWYHFTIETDLGHLQIFKSDDNDNAVTIDSQFGTGGSAVSPWQLTVYEEKYRQPDWIYGGVFYHIFVDRFAKGSSRSDEDRRAALMGKSKMAERHLRDDWGGQPEYLPDEEGEIINNDFFGGDIPGIIEKLPYLSDLGVTCLYLSPIFKAFSNHKYDTGDYMDIAPEFGTISDFRELCKKAELMGIKVILDGVFAHTGSDSIYFNKYGTYGKGGAWNDSSSPYRSWYKFQDDGTYDSWWGISTLPKTNKKEESYVEFITGREGVARKWLREGASGWRLDVADELPVSFMKSLSKAVHEEKPGALLIGEVWEDASYKSAYDERKNYFEGDKLDSVMNYPFKNAIISFLRSGDGEKLALTVERIMENYPPFAVNALMNNLGTHDSLRILTALAGKEIEPRLETRAEQARTHLSTHEREKGIKLLKMAVALQMTLPGVPCIYYGDEAEMEGYGDPFNRACYPWGNENEELIKWYKDLIAVRRENTVFEKGLYRTLEATEGIFSFARYSEEGSSEIRITIDLVNEKVRIWDLNKDILFDRKV